MPANENGLSADPDGRPATPRSALRRPTAWLAAAGVLVLLAAAFVLSYDAFVAMARSGGVTDRLVRFYPVVFDAVLVVALAAIFVLRSARFYVRWLTWLAMLGILAVCAAAGAVHAADVELPQQPLAAAVATLPFVMLVLAFRLWLTMLRHIRRQGARRRAGIAADSAAIPDEEAATRVVPTHDPTYDPVAHDATVVYDAAAHDAVPEHSAHDAVPDPDTVGTPTRGHVRSVPPGTRGSARTVVTDDATRPVARARGGEEAPDAVPETPVAAVSESAVPVASAAPDTSESTDAGRTGTVGDEDELVADAPPMSDPVSDEADEPVGDRTDESVIERTGETAEERAAETGQEDGADRNTADAADESDEEWLWSDEPAGQPQPTASPPSGKMRSSPLPPLDWGPGLGGLTGRRRVVRARDEEEDPPTSA